MLEHTCEICGKKYHKKLTADGKTVCYKHKRQFKKYGRFLDKNPRTIYDKNEIHIDSNNHDIAYMDLYDKQCNKIATTMFDAEDIPKVKYTKWRLSASGYVVNMPKYKDSNKHFSRTILDTDQFVDHINGNKLDNRKCNLRIVSKSQNAMNQAWPKGYAVINNKYQAHIKINQKAINLGTYVDEAEAQWARWYAERILFKEFARNANEPFILEKRKQDIKQYVDRKVQRL